MKIILLIILPLSLSLCGKSAQLPTDETDPHLSKHPAPGTSIVRFIQVDSQVYAGSKPKNEADFNFLHSLNIRYLLEARFLPLMTGKEKKRASDFGISFLSVEMNASTVAPSETHVNEALRIMHDPKYQPLYLHCVLGRDRTAMLVGLYRMYFLGVPEEQAWQEMLDSGFKDSLILRGLKDYFDNHRTPPSGLVE